MSMRNALATVLATSLLAAVPAAGQIAGFKISDPVIDTATQEVDFDVVAYGLTAAAPGDLKAGLPIDRALTGSYYTQTTGGGPGNFYYTIASDWNTVGYPALDFGDGNTQQVMTLALDVAGPPNTFRGSFSHTYPVGVHHIHAKLTPDGEYQAPGLETAGLTTGYPVTGTLVNYFAAHYKVRATTGATTTSFDTSTTITYPNTVRYVFNDLKVFVTGPPPVMSVVAGTCPGVVTLKIDDLQPGDKVALYTSTELGETPVPGACAPAVIDLDNAFHRTTRFGDANGEILITRTFPPAQCSLLMQAINLGVGGSNCGTSNILATPTAFRELPREGTGR